MSSRPSIPVPKQVEVLLVSACPEECCKLCEIIQSHSRWCVHSVSTCRQALEYLRTHPLGVVISDEKLPDGDWRRLLAETASLPFKPNLIVSTGRSDDRLWSEVLNLGGYDMLMTPFDPEEVFEVGTVAWQSWWNRVELSSMRKCAQRESAAERTPVAARAAIA
jgi:DNA-binding NtrC family response regulator